MPEQVLAHQELVGARDRDVDVLVVARDAAKEEVKRPAGADEPRARQVAQQRGYLLHLREWF